MGYSLPGLANLQIDIVDNSALSQTICTAHGQRGLLRDFRHGPIQYCGSVLFQGLVHAQLCLDWYVDLCRHLES